MLWKLVWRDSISILLWQQPLFFIERECIEIIYCQYYPAIWGVISNTLLLWKTNRMASSRNELENTPPRQFTSLGPQDCHRTGIFQYIPPLSSVLLRYISSPRTILINLVTVDEKRSGVLVCSGALVMRRRNKLLATSLPIPTHIKKRRRKEVKKVKRAKV